MLSRLLAFSLLCATSFAAIIVETPAIRGIPVVRPAEAGAFALTVTNKGLQAATGIFHATLTPPSGGPVIQVKRVVTLPDGESLSVPVSLAGAELGVWTVAHTFESNATGTKPEAGSCRFAVMEPTGPNPTAPAFRFGVVAHIESKRDKAERAREIAAAALIGTKTIRSNPGWWDVQPEPTRWKWERMDEMLDAFAADGMECQALLAYTVGWAADPSIKWDEKQHGLNVVRSAPNPEAWRAYVAASVQRYKGRIKLWEPWNEPDLTFWRGTTEEYLELARITLEEVRRHDPEAKVMTGGFATLTPHAARKLNPDLQARVMRELGPRFDYHAVHEHGPFPDFAYVVDGALTALRATSPAPVPPLFFNETALTAIGGPDAERIQAEALVKKTAFARSRGAVGYLWYDLRNDGTDPANPEHNYGLVTHDFQPKPVYTAFNTFARHVVPRPFLRQLDTGKGRWVFLFGNAPDEAAAGSRLLVLWNEDPTAQNEPLLLGLPGATRATLMDLDGNVTLRSITADTLAVNLSSRPVYLLIEGASDIAVKGRLVGPPRPYFGGPGEDVQVACEFINPFDHPVRVKVEWTSPMAMTVVAPAARTLDLPPLGKAVSTLAVRLPSNAAYRFGQSGRLRVDYSYEGAPLAGRLQIPVRYGTVRVPSRDVSIKRAPDVVLDRRDQLHSFVEADPNMIDQRWTGPVDLSARVWLGADETALVLSIEVTDDIHHQTQPNPVDMWREDSVQVVIDVPDQGGAWEFGLAENTAGPITHYWNIPQGLKPSQAPIDLRIAPSGASGQGRVYTARIPRAALGLTDAVLRGGFRFNIAINDHDGAGRANALQLVPGIVYQKSNENLPYVTFP